jgi:DNA-binding XRE family transcriptional regulator
MIPPSTPAVAKPAFLVHGLPMRFGVFRRAAFGRTLGRHRTMCGLSRETLAAVVGLTPADIAAIEDQELMPQLDTVFALADSLGTDAAELLHDTRTETERMVVEDWLFRHGACTGDHPSAVTGDRPPFGSPMPPASPAPHHGGSPVPISASAVHRSGPTASGGF